MDLTYHICMYIYAVYIQRARETALRKYIYIYMDCWSILYSLSSRNVWFVLSIYDLSVGRYGPSGPCMTFSGQRLLKNCAIKLLPKNTTQFEWPYLQRLCVKDSKLQNDRVRSINNFCNGIGSSKFSKSKVVTCRIGYILSWIGRWT